MAALEEELDQLDQRRARERRGLQSRMAVLVEQSAVRQAAAESEQVAELRQLLEAREDQLGELRRQLADADARGRALENAGQRQVEMAAHQAAELERQRELVAKLAHGIGEVQKDIERVAASRAWRIGHGLARGVGRLTMRRRLTDGAVAGALVRLRALESDTALDVLTGETPAAASGLDAGERSDLARQVRAGLGPVPQRRRWPSVSIVVLNRNGEPHLRRLFAGLTDHTDYPRFECIVVDNASTDGSLNYLSHVRLPFPLQLVKNAENLSFSEGNNVGAGRAHGRLLLFLNNDIEPFEPGWLREMVALALAGGVGAVGATLLHATELDGRVPLVQHRGIRMRLERDGIRPFNLGDGESLFSDAFGRDVPAPAATAACLMIAADRYAAIGGFAGGYRYGTEDVDLGLQLSATGAAVITSGRAHLLHRESSTQNAEGRAFMRENRLANRQLFGERWGSRVRREYRLERLGGGSFWTEGGGPHLAVTLTSLEPADGYGDWYTGHELGAALGRLGWRVTYVQRRDDEWYTLPEDLDYLLVLLDAYDPRRATTQALKLAWVRNWTERWIEHGGLGGYDLVLASSRRSAELIEARTGIPAELFPLATNPERFTRLAAEPTLASDVAFAGNRWNRPRAVEQIELSAERSLRVYGSGWEEAPAMARFAQGPVAYERLPAVYSSVKVVVDDGAEHTLPYDAVNSRVFDALACGTVVLSNCEAGVRELFDDDFPVWSDGASLHSGVERLLADDAARARLAARYGQVVRERHTYDHRARRLVELLTESESRLSFCIKVGAPSRAVAAEWGDMHFADALRRELHRRGCRSIVQTLDEWDAPAGLECDVALHLKGLSLYTPKPGQVNVLWCISHPDSLTHAECESYDLVCVASQPFAAELSPQITTPVVVLEQATDPRLFFPDPDPRRGHELLFVANSRKVRRRILTDLLPTTHDLAVYGTNWDGLIDARHIAGEHIANHELRRAYSSAAIVLNDHWNDMREHGFISNRIYDALACEALVLSDHLPELYDRFGEAVVTYCAAEELPGLIERLLADPQERARRGRIGREAVIAGHTFAHRVDDLLAALTEHVGDTRLIRTSQPPAGRIVRRRRGRRHPAAWAGALR